jgi:hypothetical protein
MDFRRLKKIHLHRLITFIEISKKFSIKVFKDMYKNKLSVFNI